MKPLDDKEKNMKLKEYVPADEVRRTCKELKIRDWTRLKGDKVLPQEARTILSKVNVQKMKISLEDFRRGLEVELEHGTRFKDANVTNNHPLLTGKIVLAHLKETMDYYQRLEVAEIEGDLLKATVANNAAKVRKYHRKLAEARRILSQSEARQLK